MNSFVLLVVLCGGLVRSQQPGNHSCDVPFSYRLGYFIHTFPEPRCIGPEAHQHFNTVGYHTVTAFDVRNPAALLQALYSFLTVPRKQITNAVGHGTSFVKTLMKLKNECSLVNFSERYSGDLMRNVRNLGIVAEQFGKHLVHSDEAELGNAFVAAGHFLQNDCTN